MKILVTAGNTQTPVDRVRCITNIFSGRTGAQIACRAHERGHTVVFLTSHSAVVDSLAVSRPRSLPHWRIRPYRTFDDLDLALDEELAAGAFDVVIHAAAVSDYRVAGVFAPVGSTSFDPISRAWRTAPVPPHLNDVTTGKVKSSHSELWMRLVPTPKLIDKIRSAWGFNGLLVKFKLEVGLNEYQLEQVAERAREASSANLMVANTLEEMHEWALVGAAPRGYVRVTRAALADHLLDQLERLHGRVTQG